MRTRTLVAATTAASVAALTPAAVATQSLLADRAPAAVVRPVSPSSSGSASGDATSDHRSTAQGSTPKATAAGGTAKAVTRGVVMIDTAMPGGQGAGTGMVLTSSGTVLTNYHVVEGSTQVRVKVPGGQTYTATVAGHDESHDVAVLKLRGARGMATVKLDRDGVRSGESVAAVGQGNGEGVLYSVKGRITAINRSITASDSSSMKAAERLTGLLETDAKIVPGYSGGPLFDADGEVVGIDTAASSGNVERTVYGAVTSGGGQGYAIPINSAMTIANSILAGTKTSTNHIGARAALGIKVLAAGDSMPGASGVQVQDVVDGNGAAKAGLAVGDTITSIGSSQIEDQSDLAAAMDRYYPGQKVPVGWTDTQGQSHTASVTLQTSTAN